MMHELELETQLRQAQMGWEEVVKKDASLQERIAARNAVLQAERALFLIKGEETAVAYEWEHLWDESDPCVLSSGLKTYLIYNIRIQKAHIEQISPPSKVACVEFVHCYAHKLSGINDEVLSGHPLWGKGLDLYGVYEIIHSRWLAEVKRINMVHENYYPRRWEALKHYLFVFHDDLFECLSMNHHIEILQNSFERAIELARTKIFE